VSAENNSWTIVLRDTLITWGVPLFVSSIPYLAWIDGVADFFRAVGWRFAVVLYSILLFVCAALFIAWQKAKNREKVALAKLDDDFRAHLKVVNDKGYEIDTRNGQAVCPECNINKDRLSYMAQCTYRGDCEHPYLYCRACDRIYWINDISPLYVRDHSRTKYVID
jgi:uncharacterized protein YbaR (Trm112 family)